KRGGSLRARYRIGRRASITRGGSTMKAALTALVAVAFVFTTARADEKKADGKEVTLKGTITCLKCDLKKADKCATVIQVKEKDKDVIYVFDEAGNKKFHSKICKTPTKGS